MLITNTLDIVLKPKSDGPAFGSRSGDVIQYRTDVMFCQECVWSSHIPLFYYIIVFKVTLTEVTKSN